MSVCLSVRLFTFEVQFKRLFAPLPKVECPIFLEIRNPWGKSNGKKWSQIWTFLFGSGLNRQKKSSYFCLILPYKTRWKPRFLMVKGGIANFGIFLDVLEFLRFGLFFPFFKQFGFGVFLVHPETTLPDGLETSGQWVYC